MPAPVYRGCTLGQALEKSLDDLIGKEEIPMAMREQIMRLYDTAICEQLKDSRMSQAAKAEQLHGRIEDGKLETYRFFNGNWTFDLKTARLKGRAFSESGPGSRDGCVIKNLHVEAVDCKVAELEQAPIEETPLVASASGEADEGNTAATTADDELDDALQQFDGASDPAEPTAALVAPAASATASRSMRLPQLDGEGDEEENWDEVEEPQQDVPGGGRNSTALDDDGAEELNSDDDSENDTGGGAQAVQYTNTVHAQFRKVKRQRNKWNCELTAGVAKIDGLEYAFTKCDANFLF